MKLYAPTPAFDGNTDNVDTTQKNPIGTRAFDNEGNEYVYLAGVGSTLAGSWVTFDETGQTALIAANAVGPVAIAMAAIVASSWGWYLVNGETSAAQYAAATADNAALYIGGSGTVDDAVVAGDLIVGAVSRGTIGGATTGAAQIRYPFVTNALG